MILAFVALLHAANSDGLWNRYCVEAKGSPARVTITVAPDEHYEGFYRALLASKLPPASRLAIEEALRQASASRYVVYRR